MSCGTAMIGLMLLTSVQSVTYKDTDYRVIVLKMPKNAKDSTKWGYPADAI